MAHPAGNDGFIAPRPPNVEYVVQAQQRNGKRIELEPTGVFVNGDRGVGVWLNHAGVDGGGTFHLPEDPAFLRDIADAITKLADQIESRRGKREHKHKGKALSDQGPAEAMLENNR